jgi:predicted nuclease with TOPRIM domain
MSREHNREPIKHTCPDIDKYIKWIKMEIVKERDLKNMDEKELFDAASSMSSKLEECIDQLEELRKSNDTLRQWGIEEARNVDDLEARVYELESKLPLDAVT